MPNGTATANLLRPKLLSVVREGYSLESFRHDLLAGLTVSIVALPLSMAIAVASGTSPERGLYASIFGGAVVSACSTFARPSGRSTWTFWTPGTARSAWSTWRTQLLQLIPVMRKVVTTSGG